MRCAPAVDARRSSSPTPSARRRLLSWSPSSASSSKSPSPGLLSILAGIVASTCPVDAYPLSFLCPRAAIPDDQDAPATSSAARASTKNSNKRKQRKPRISPRRTALPPKFAQGEDGVWRPVSTYALYGSTMCLSCTGDDDSALETSDDPVADDTVPSPSTSATTSVPPPTSTESTYITSAPTELLSSLPKGWAPKEDDTPLDIIIAMSLVLAFVILFMIIGCLFWRKTLRRQRNRKEIEKKKKMRRHLTDNEQEEVATIEQEIAKKKRLWERAFVRWREGAHLTARRNRRGFSSSSSYARDVAASSSSISLNPSNHASLATPSRRSSPPRSRRSSHSSTSSERSDYIIPPPTAPDPLSSSAKLSDQDETLSPPAYHRRRSIQHPGPPATSGRDMKPSTSAPHISPPPLELADGYSTAAHSAHVATDDKGRLAMLAEQASAPPTAQDDAAITGLSVPLLEEVEQSSAYLQDSSQPSTPVELPFPPPPSKGKMPAYFDFDLEQDMYTSEPEFGPSAPPFEVHESNGILDASAPPMDSDALSEVDASAPPLEEGQEVQSMGTIADTTGEDHTPLASQSHDSASTTATTSLVLPTYTP